MDKGRKSADDGPMPLGDAIRRCYSGVMTQVRLADALGVEQKTISQWSTANNRPSLEKIRDMEIACNRPVGTVLRWAGFVEDVESVEAAIQADAAITSEDTRQVLIAAYRAAAAGSKP